MFIGELSIVEARVTFTSEFSIEVLVDVYAENLTTMERRLTNRASLWYVNLSKSPPEDSGHRREGVLHREMSRKEGRFQPAPVPPLKLSPEAHAAGLKRYKLQKAERAESSDSLDESFLEEESATNLSQLALPSDCNSLKICQGGVIMKLIDNTAAVSAVRHCRTNVVTAALDALNFRNPIFLGNIIHVTAIPSFSSSRSMELEVAVDGEDITTGRRWRSVDARLTFVSLDENGKPKPMPPLVVDTEAAQRRFQKGKERYEVRKKKRKINK